MNQANKMHTTNYFDTFIEVADDCKVSARQIAETKSDKKTVASRQFELLSKNPYKYTSDDILFQVLADKNGLTESEYKLAREQFFAKGQPCLRASPLTKQFGWILISKKMKLDLIKKSRPRFNPSYAGCWLVRTVLLVRVLQAG